MTTNEQLRKVRIDITYAGQSHSFFVDDVPAGHPDEGVLDDFLRYADIFISEAG